MSSPALVIVEAIMDWKMISMMELFGCIFGIYGAFIITNPDFVMKNCFCCCNKSSPKINEKEEFLARNNYMESSLNKNNEEN